MSEQFKNAALCWEAILSDAERNKDLLSVIEKFARENTAPAEIVFGTSGWRAEIGTDYTFHNVRVVTDAIIEMFRQSERTVMEAMGVKDFREIQDRGVIVGHDNRFLGPEFAMEVLGLLQKGGIKTWYAGEAITPEFSCSIELLNAACAINLTPSHNPANYSGFKFNPSDGGPAGSEITGKIEEIANSMMEKSINIPSSKATTIGKTDLTSVYIRYVAERQTLDIKKIQDFIESSDCLICVDNVHGATRGRLQRIIGESPKIQYLRT
ncbi:MAG: phosphomannomutase, partial [Thermodesulfovibrionales bacterium]